jgi:hypothetical protein
MSAPCTDAQKMERIFLLRVSRQADSATVASTVGCYRQHRESPWSSHILPNLRYRYSMMDYVLTHTETVVEETRVLERLGSRRLHNNAILSLFLHHDCLHLP